MLKKQFIAIAFLFILLAPVATMVLFLHIEKRTLKREIKSRIIAGIDPSELVLLQFTLKEAKEKLQWEHAKEFEYKEQMYDVVMVQTKGDSVFYRCWWDHEETKLNQRLKKMVALAFGEDEESSETQELFYSFLGSFFYTAPFQWQATASTNLESRYQDVVRPYFFTALSQSPPTPPPKRC
ncbi:hypothetical protein F3C99_06360 [Vitellibacter sp. q18]|nr:hypothetical protein [Aequorivita lutea]